MTELLTCRFVEKTIQGTIKLISRHKEEFISQYREALEKSKGVSGVVYVFRAQKSISRLKGKSNVLYIGETKNDVWSRYNVINDTNDYWHVYSHIMDNYGFISIDVYVTSNHKITEKTFLDQYYQAYKELPPLNRKG